MVNALFAIVFFSGAAALVYEVSWARQLGVLFGHTVESAAVVLTAYFAGMAGGYALGGHLSKRVRPLRGYAIAEFVVAAWATLVPLLLSATESGITFRLLHDPVPEVQLAARWMFCMLLLLPATMALGATLPMIAEWLSTIRNAGRIPVAAVYAANTAGAFLGVVGTTCWLLVNLGVVGSSLVAAGLSSACGIAAILLQRLEQRDGSTIARRTPAEAAPRFSYWPYFPAAISGFGILALEVLYTRLFSLVFHNSTYTFGAVLAACLAGLALGAAATRLALRWVSPHALLIGASGIGATATVFSVVVFVRTTHLEYYRTDGDFTDYMLGAFGLVLLVVLPPITILGTLLPALWADPGREGIVVSRLVARTTFANALAAALGAGGASLILLPSVGLWNSFVLVGASFLLPAVVVLAIRGRIAASLIIGAAFLVPAIPIASAPGPERWATESDERLVRRWDSAYGWVDVVEGPGGVKKVRQNLHYRFGTTGDDAPRAARQAHLPLLLHPSPRTVLFLGLGTGVTASGAIPHAEVERIDIVELIPEVVEAARLLSDANRGVVDHPKVAVRIDDARHDLLASNRRYDAIVCDLFVPWESETGYLYTVEHFRTVRSRLNSGGLYCLWLPLYQLDPRGLELIADSFAAIFHDVSLWWGHLDSRRPIAALIGCESPLLLDAAPIDDRLQQLWRNTPIDREIGTAHEVIGRYLGHWEPRHPDRLNTDEHPRIEFLAPLAHRNRTLLEGHVLRRYHDDVLNGLPDRSRHFTGHPSDIASIRANHRRELFGR